uniref:Uncharacterized protein n=1 Tax=viral metagenome TaxID=1070528 RepID=A0A6C0DC01_9ZZZZ
MMELCRDSNDFYLNIIKLSELTTKLVNISDKLYNTCFEIYKDYYDDNLTNINVLFLTIKVSSSLYKELMKHVSNEIINMKEKLDIIMKGNNQIKNKISSSFSSLVVDIINVKDLIENKFTREDVISIFSKCHEIWQTPEVIEHFKKCYNLDPVGTIIDASHIMSQKIKLITDGAFYMSKAIRLKFELICQASTDIEELNELIGKIEDTMYKYFESDELLKMKSITRNEYDNEMALLGFKI